MKFSIYIVLGLFASNLLAQQFPVFDGHRYNDLYYPLVDCIDWQNEAGEFHEEIHIHHKVPGEQIELSAEVGEKDGHPVIWLNYYLKFRGEHVCRRIPAPPGFTKGTKLYSYRDNSNPKYDNIFLTITPMQTSKNLVAINMEPYQRCEESDIQDNKPYEQEEQEMAKKTELAPSEQQRAPASDDTSMIPGDGPKNGKGVNIDYENTAMPFSF